MLDRASTISQMTIRRFRSANVRITSLKNVNLHDHARFISDLGDFAYVKYTSKYTPIR